VTHDASILDFTLRNLSKSGVEDVVVVVGYAAAEFADRQQWLEDRHGVHLTLVHNDRAEEWNNAYSLWCAREYLAGGALLVNGDTLHPPSVEEALLAAAERGPGGDRRDGSLLLAVDTGKRLGEEEMKVLVDGSGAVTHISKRLDPHAAYGEYIGVARVGASCVPALVDALEATWRRDPGLFYEDGFQHLVHQGETVLTTPIPPGTAWVEVDDHRDLALAREVAWRC
jgi:choline kinase